MRRARPRAGENRQAEIVSLGDAALIVRLGESLGEVLAAAKQIAAAEIPGVSEIAPAFASVAIFLESPDGWENCREKILTALREKKKFPAHARAAVQEIPVCYEEDFAPDLGRVAQLSGLSPNEVAQRHAAGDYCVRCVGFTPGFPYLSGLPNELATPRQATPRQAVPAGAVAIGGRQTGIYPLASPGGWNIVGRTPLRLFDATRQPAALLRAGDRVRFVPITGEAFFRWET